MLYNYVVQSCVVGYSMNRALAEFEIIKSTHWRWEMSQRLHYNSRIGTPGVVINVIRVLQHRRCIGYLYCFYLVASDVLHCLYWSIHLPTYLFDWSVAGVSPPVGSIRNIRLGISLLCLHFTQLHLTSYTSRIVALLLHSIFYFYLTF